MINALAVNGTGIFAGAYSSDMFLSTDNGSSWNPITKDFFTGQVFAFAVKGANIIAGAVNGVAYSADSGVHWSDSTIGLVDPDIPYTSVRSLVYAGTNVIAGTSEACSYRRTTV